MADQPKIEIYRHPQGRYGWTVRVGDRYSSHLDFGEMLSTLVHLTIKGEVEAVSAPYGGLRTDEEHKAHYRSMGTPEEEIERMATNGDL